MLTLFLSSFLTGCGGEAPKQNTFDNLPPFSPIISLTPTDPVTTDDLVVGIITESTDPDGDEVTTGYVWTVNGVISDQTSETVPSSATTKGEVWTVNVISNDGSLDSAPATFSVTIKNTAPVIDSTTATEGAAFGDALSVVVDSVSDADNDTVELDYSWTVNGEGSTYDTGDIPADVTQVNEIWVLTITPNDGDTDGEAVTVTYDFTNAVPVVNSVTIDPDPANTSDELSVIVDVTDAEEDVIESYTYEWLINGESAGTDATLSAGTAIRDDVVSVSVIASDAYGGSAAVSSADLTIGNATPTASISIDQTSAVTTDTLSVTYSSADADNDTLTTTIDWLVDGASTGISTDTFDSSNFVKGQSITAQITVDDAIDTFTETSAAVVIGSTEPTPSISIDQNIAVTTFCLSVTYSSADDDNDTLTTTIDWLVDGASTGISTDTLDGSNFAKGQSVTAQITVNDGTDTITETSAAVVIGNTAPTGSISIDQASAVTTDTLSVTITSADVDNDTLTTTIDWLVDGASTGISTDTLDGSNFIKGQSVSAQVTIDDGTDTVTETSAAVVIDNTAPTASVAIDQLVADTTDTLTATATTDDADQDTLTPVYDWMVDSVSTGETGNTLASSFFSKGQSVTVTVTVDDGSGAVSATSAALVIGNAVPTASIAIDQISAVTTDTLSFTYSASDADLDTLTTTVDWLVNGVSTGISTVTLDDSNFVKGQSVTVQITVDDGTDIITETSAAVVIDNTLPTADTVIGPFAAVYGEDVVCNIINESDADSDTVSISEVQWAFGSGATTTTTGDTLALTVADHGAETSVSCMPTFTDGEASVVGTESDFVSISDLALRHLVRGDLVITEIMNNPSAQNDADSEWFEVWVNTAIDTTVIGGGNRGDINLNGLAISDDGTDFDQLDLDIIVLGGDYLVFGENDDTSLNGGVVVDYIFIGSLSNGLDEIYILDTERTVTLDEVLWDDGATYPDTNGASMNLDPSAIGADSNENGDFWCDSISTFGDGDFGTPGADNDTCP
ncbi:MAG: beta strand repeat-containing protein [Myxococcota bacterium]